MSREINNKLDCCNRENKEWCKSAVDMIPYYIKQIKEKQQNWGEYYKNSENTYNIVHSNIKNVEKQELDMKKYFKQVKETENKKMKDLMESMKNYKKTIKNWDKEIEDYNKQLKIFKKRVSVCNKKSRCPNGTRKNKKSGKCEKK